MAFPGDYDLDTYDKLLVPTTGASHTNFPIWIPADQFTADFKAELRSDWGDLRVTDSDGTTQRARHIRADNAGTILGVIVNRSTSSSGTTELRFYANGTDTEPARDATYGSDNAYNGNLEAVYPLQEAANNDADGWADVTVNDNHLTGSSMADTRTGAPMGGNSPSFDGTSDYLSRTSAVVASRPMSVAGLFLTDADEFTYMGGVFQGTGSLTGYACRLSGTTGGDPISALDVTLLANTTTGFTTATWFAGHFVFNSDADRRAFIDGGSKGTNTNSITTPTPTHTHLGSARHNGNALLHFDGSLQEWRFYSVTLADEWVADEADNLLDQWDFQAEFVGGATAYTLTADTGAFTLSGQAATLKAARKITAAAGSFTLTGQSAGLHKGFTLTSATGSFTLSGQDAGLRATRTLGADAGAFTLSGQDAGLLRGLRLTSDAGAYSLDGQSAALLFGRRLDVGAGAFTLTGQDAGLLKGRTLAADVGEYTLDGIAAGLLVTRLLAGGTGAFVLTGQAAGLSIIVLGPYCIADMGVYVPGVQHLTRGSRVYVPGSQDAGVYIPQAQDTGVYVPGAQDAGVYVPGAVDMEICQ